MSAQLQFSNQEFTLNEFVALNKIDKVKATKILKERVKEGLIFISGTRSHGGRGKPATLYKNLQQLVQEGALTKDDKMGNKILDKLDEKLDCENNSTVEGTLKAFEILIDNFNPNWKEISQVCPICKHKLFSNTTNKGVTVRCNQPIDICQTNENPFGYSNNVQNAYEILVEKWGEEMKKSSILQSAFSLKEPFYVKNETPF